MIFKLGETFEYRTQINSISNIPILSASPVMSVRNASNGYYWNGLFFQSSVAHISLINYGDGTYGYDIDLSETGTFEFNAFDSTYGFSDTFSITVSDGIHELIGAEHEISAEILVGESLLEGLSVEYKVKRVSDNFYFDGISFVSDETSLELPETTPGVYSTSFTSEDEGNFLVTITEATTSFEESYTLVFGVSGPQSLFPYSNGLYIVSAEEFTGTDGGSGVITDKYNMPIKGATIEAYNKVSKEVFRALSDNKGKWTLHLPEGTYIFIVNHDNYISATMEREVH